MAQLIRGADEEIWVQYRQFQLFDLDGADDFDGSVPEDVYVAPGYLSVQSVGHTHHAALRFEAWDSKPPSQPDWVESWRLTFASTSGLVRAVSVMGDQSGEFQLGPPGSVYGLHLYRGGDLDLLATDPVHIPRGTERYLLQFWWLREIHELPVQQGPRSSVDDHGLSTEER